MNNFNKIVCCFSTAPAWLLLLLLFWTLNLAITGNAQARPKLAPQAQNGILDLSNWDFGKDGC